MNRPKYLSEYSFDWELFDVIIGGKSALDAKSFLAPIGSEMESVYSFLEGYGFDQNDPVLKAELFGTFQESLLFIRKYFLKEGNPEGLDLSIPPSLYSITEISHLFLMAMRKSPGVTEEEALWAGIVLKVVHTILHADKDLRYSYFSTIQQQIFDRFYKHLHRDLENNLYLGVDEATRIPLLDFEVKAKKSRDSIIMKLLHKTENVAEELFDRIGVRFVTFKKIDTLRVIKFLQSHNIVMAHNIKPSRSRNTLVDLRKLKNKSHFFLKAAIRNQLNEEDFERMLEQEIGEGGIAVDRDVNRHTSEVYRSIQFTSRQLIKYKIPFMQEFKSLRDMAKEIGDGGPLAKRILSLDMSKMTREVRFFYPFEVQVVDAENHRKNTEGEASHQEYKKSQVRSAMLRLFRPLLEHKKII